jgi:cation diffusion facilitator CzcD-associated flavoprotein CzcO
MRIACGGRIMASVMRIVIVGAGAAGLAMAMRLKQAGHTDFTIVERSRGVRSAELRRAQIR